MKNIFFKAFSLPAVRLAGNNLLTTLIVILDNSHK